MPTSKHQNHYRDMRRGAKRQFGHWWRLSLGAATLTLLAGIVMTISAPSLTSSVYAAHEPSPQGCPGGAPGPKADDTKCPHRFYTDCESETVNRENCKIVDRLLTLINALSAAVGVIIVIMITVGGIQYSASSDNPQAAMAAKKRVYNAVFALLCYIFLFSFLQWVIPGGAL